MVSLRVDVGSCDHGDGPEKAERMSDVSPRLKSTKRKPKKANQTKTADALFGKIIRSRGRCEHCGTTSDLQCAHGFSRRYRAVRWDERNAFALCRADHLFFTMRPLEWDDWLVDRWGWVLYGEMRELAQKGRNPVLKEVIERLRDVA